MVASGDESLSAPGETSLRPFLSSSLAVLLAALLIQPAVAQDASFSRDGNKLLTDSLQHSLSLPVPAWAQGAGGSDTAALQLVRTPDGPTIEVLEFIPTSETIDTWSKLLAALVVDEPDYTIAALEQSMSAALTQGCTPDSLSLGIARPATKKLPRVLFALCGHYAGEMPGTVAGGGEVMIATIYKTKKGAVKVYQEWRGGGFDIHDRAAWPVSPAEFDAAAEALQSVTRITAK